MRRRCESRCRRRDRDRGSAWQEVLTPRYLSRRWHRSGLCSQRTSRFRAHLGGASHRRPTPPRRGDRSFLAVLTPPVGHRVPGQSGSRCLRSTARRPRDQPIFCLVTKLLLATHNEHKRREFARLLDRLRGRCAAARVRAAAGGRRDVRGERARQGTRGRRRHRRGHDRRRLGHRGRGSRRGARGALGALRRRARRPTRRTWRSSCARRPAGSGLAYVCALVYVDPRTGVERVFEARCTGTLAAAPRGVGGFGYDPAFLPERGPSPRSRARRWQSTPSRRSDQPPPTRRAS